MVLGVLVCLLGTPSPGGADPKWSRRSLERYRHARAGLWHGAGTLHNTLNGALLADVELTESVEVRAVAEDDGGSYRSERVLVYRHSNGTLLTSVGRRSVPPVRYSHVVTLGLAGEPNGRRGLRSLFLRAVTPSGNEVATAWAGGAGPTRRVLSSVFELSVRPVAAKRRRRWGDGRSVKQQGRLTDPAKDGGSIPSTPPSRDRPTVATPPVYEPAAVMGATREEYVLIAPALRLRPPRMVYRRTGRCPSWCGAGVCTLEVQLQKQRPRGAVVRAFGRAFDAMAGKPGPWWQRQPSRTESLRLLAGGEPAKEAGSSE